MTSFLKTIKIALFILFPQDWHSLSIDPMWTLISCRCLAVLTLIFFFRKSTLKFHDCHAEVWNYNCEHSTYKGYYIIYIRFCRMHQASEWFESTLSYVLLLPISVYTKLCVFLKFYIAKHMFVRYQGYL